MEVISKISFFSSFKIQVRLVKIFYVNNGQYERSNINNIRSLEGSK